MENKYLSDSVQLPGPMLETLLNCHKKGVLKQDQVQQDSPILNWLFDNGFLNTCMYFNSQEKKKGRVYYITDLGEKYLKQHSMAKSSC